MLSLRQERAFGAIGLRTSVVYVALLMLSFECFSGALRYVLDRAGAASLTYLPKVLAIGFLVLLIRGRKVVRFNIIAASLLGISAIWAFFQGAGIGNVFFAFYAWSPFFVGIASARYVVGDRTFDKYLMYLVILTAIGVLIDGVYELPWRGYEYSIGGTQLEGSRVWSAFEVPRPAGFARLSAAAGIFMAVCGAYLLPRIRRKKLRGIIGLALIVPIAVTTHKASIAGYVLVLIFWLGWKNRFLWRWGVYGIVVMGVFLPFSSGLTAFLPTANSATGLFLLASFDDRLSFTWPIFINVVSDHSGSILGLGFGNVGSAAKNFKVLQLASSTLADTSVADSTPLYLWGAFGVFGILLYCCIPKIIQGLRRSDQNCQSLALSVIAIAVIAIMTDAPEALVCSYFIGLAIGYILHISSVAARNVDRQFQMRHH